MQIKDWAYWGVLTAVLAVVVHLGFVLFQPLADTKRRIGDFEAFGPVNQIFQIPNITPKSTTLAHASPDISYAFCRFDLTNQPIIITAKIPDSYWSISMYSEKSDNFYVINNVQAGQSELLLLLAKVDPDADPSGEILDIPENTILISAPSSSGLVVLRAAIPDKSSAEAVRHFLKQSRCEPV